MDRRSRFWVYTLSTVLVCVVGGYLVAVLSLSRLIDIAISNPVKTAQFFGIAGVAFIAIISFWSLKTAYLGGTAGRVLDAIARNVIPKVFYEDQLEQAILDLQYEPRRLSAQGQRWAAAKLAFRLYIGVWRNVSAH